MNQDDNKEQERDNGDYQNYIINTNQLTNKTKHYQSQQQQQPSIPKYVSQNQHQQQVKQLTNHLSFKNPIHKVKKMTVIFFCKDKIALFIKIDFVSLKRILI